jgi:hypothetical protein
LIYGRLTVALWLVSLALGEQPIPFSHKKHMSLSLKCSDCHNNTDPVETMTFPLVSKCMLCHVEVAKDRPEIQKLARYAKLKQEVPWVTVGKIPDWVYWSHGVHLEAGAKCSDCHGDVATMDVMVRSTSVTTMGGCVACHQNSKAPTGCLSCHEGKH